jgi:hypothetical protein|tara:strand:+ start:63 stop:215 length:153 start_codon:yes stop_codon:yes gene_type:complete
MKRKKTKLKPKSRNWLAVHAFNRKGGPMKNRKKEANKRACRTVAKSRVEL